MRTREIMLKNNDRIDEVKQAVSNCVSMWDWMSGDRRLPTTAELDKYFIDNYGGDKIITTVFGERGGVITFEIREDHLFIKDFMAYGDGFDMFNCVKEVACGMPIRCAVADTNIRLLNTCLRVLKFKIVSLDKHYYTLERR